MLIHIQKEEIIMANKRTLKKAITFICEELFAEGVAISLTLFHRKNASQLH